MDFPRGGKEIKKFNIIKDKSSVHCAPVTSQSAVKKEVNFAASISKGKSQEMKPAWQYVLEIISVQFLAQQRLATRGYSNKTSNIMQLFLHAEDIPKLNVVSTVLHTNALRMAL
jgi:hypothetical protein